MALHWAAAGQKDDETVVQLLLEYGAEVNVRPDDGMTALHEAVGLGHQAVVRLLLDNGGDVNIRDKLGRTALHVAAYPKYDAAATLLDDDMNNKESGQNAVGNTLGISKSCTSRGNAIGQGEPKGKSRKGQRHAQEAESER
jgi:ankyrin repeat protein